MDANLYLDMYRLHEAELVRDLELRRRAVERAERAGDGRAGSAHGVHGPPRDDARRRARALSPAALRRRFGAPAGERRRPA
jgi:predicted nucleic acid-binding Zn ribbon protein